MVSDVGRLVAGRYRLTEQIGRGGMGTVWRAGDEVLGRQVAVKRLHVQPHLSPDDLVTLYERTRREARSAARIAHPNVIVVHDVVDDHVDGRGDGVQGAFEGGTGDGPPCIVMEYVPAPTLADLLTDGRTLPPEEAARIGLGMVAALRAAHGAGVLHRDVKPGNVLLAAEGRVVLTDFGIAMTADASTLTKTGEMVGSIHYMAPERIRGQKPGPASDLWALGATLYQAVEGRPPFRRLTAMEAAYAIAVDPLEPLKQGGTLAPLVEALLAKDPADRPTVEQTERALRAAVSGETTTALPRHPGGDITGGRADRGVVEEVTASAVRQTHRASGRATGGEGGRSSSQGTRGGAAPVGPEPNGDGILHREGRDHGQGGRARRPSRLPVTIAVAMTVAATVVGATLYARSNPSGDTAPNSEKSSATPSYSPSPVPKGFQLVTEKGLGVSFPVPDGWKAKKRTSGEVVYTDETGLVRLAIGFVDPAGSHPMAHFKDIEANTKVNYPTSYRKLRMQKTTFRGQPAAVWEFTFQGRARTFRAIDLGYGREGGREYDIYLSAPDVDWDTYRPTFDKVRDGFTVSARS
ncbi:serine/threonine-protein kinase [Streptomyces scabiei]|uniref:serine/threonine-protein kinase n=1 Tax=Streptomyces scabiei TaxID=1930 RepID=UPI001B302BF7|nr:MULTISPECIES: serine/threonine-protein kinase [Streptomyces]MBP5879350.1 protein kinase [Streptomyces sp. LBUM 1477]MBP5887177.1 protein kinase [Streptomyces sp. LBUM 1487]MBP5903173.1 protein kinase [Streptomyces sp. LBUM 1488]MDW8476798.1 serine/threonine-protein kinase [Streptomyces scabiei]MDX2570202.1 serine/threonine-protein kinase [Streptomyces scabiei]